MEKSRNRRPDPLALLLLFVASCASSAAADAKLDSSLLMLLDEGKASTVDVLIQTTNAAATIDAITAAGGTASQVGSVVIAHLPLQKVRSIAARPEVTRVEASQTDSLSS
jgi:hypothetical protein